jgi:hypothetical protein
MRNRAGLWASEKLLVTKVVVLACAVSAGVHAGLIPAHLSGEPRLGVRFVVAVVPLAASVAALTKWPDDRKIAAAVALLLVGLIADPRFLSRSAARQMMRIHLNQVIQQGVDELKGNYLADARAFAPYIRHILDMADKISGGIIEQFPSRFS